MKNMAKEILLVEEFVTSVEKNNGLFKIENIKKIKFLSAAMGVAMTSKCRYRHGALVVVHGRVMGASPNIQKNNPKYVDWKHSSIHAEIAALKKAGFPKRSTVYVARVNNFGEPRLSKPCVNCQEVLDYFKCKVVFT